MSNLNPLDMTLIRLSLELQSVAIERDAARQEIARLQKENEDLKRAPAPPMKAYQAKAPEPNIDIVDLSAPEGVISVSGTTA